MSFSFHILTGNAATMYDVTMTLLPEWAYLTLQGETTFFLTPNFADKSVSSVRKQTL